MNLSDLGEFGAIERIKSWLPASHAAVGPGDDAAVTKVDGFCVSTADALVDGVHFRADWSSFEDVGFKAVSVNVSDLAAMGAEPRSILMVVCAPSDVAVDTLEAIYRGALQACQRYGAEIVGGDMVRADQLVLAVTALGQMNGDAMLRSGAKPGDVIAVTGPLGRASAGLNLLMSGDPRDVTPDDALACIDAHRRPIARVAEGTRLREAGAHAAIDISDGLASDLGRMTDASGVGAEIDVVPIADEARSVAETRGWNAMQMTLSGGEDFELLVALPPDLDVKQLGLVPIGTVVERPGVWVREEGALRPLKATGFDHFRS